MNAAYRRVAELRPATADDDAFLFRVFSLHREAQFAPLGLPPADLERMLRMQFDARERQYRADHPHADFDIVLHNGEPAGYFYVHRGPDAFRIVDIAVLPGHRGQGIASELVGELVGLAKAAKKPVLAHVLLGNPAWNLWRNLGFIDKGNDGVYRRIEFPVTGTAD